MIPKTLIGPDDFHLHKRKLCKVAAVSEFLNNGGEMTQSEIDVTKTMYRQHDQDAKDYGSIDWSASSLSFGITVLNKVYAPTRCPILNIPKSIREQAVMQVLCPELTIPYDEVNPNVVEL